MNEPMQEPQLIQQPQSIQEPQLIQQPQSIQEPQQIKQPQPQQVNSQIIKIKLVNQGGHGCIFRPELNCNEEIGDIHYASKIQTNTDNIKNELNISNIIKNIPNYAFCFAPLLESCSISISKIDKEEQDKCEILYNDPQIDGKYISTKIRYIGDINIEDYFLSLPENENIITKKIYNTYYYLLKSLEKLSQTGIIHYDIKEKNIMYDINNHSPIIIDFGLSFIANNLPLEQQGDAFYTDDFYPYWCIDIVILSYVTQKVRHSEKINAKNEQINKENPTNPPIPLIDKNINENTIKELIANYILNLKDFMNKYSVSF